MPEARVLDLMRKQRRDMGHQQAFANLINALPLDGVPKDRILAHLPGLAAKCAARYVRDQGEQMFSRKIAEADDRLRFLRPADQISEG